MWHSSTSVVNTIQCFTVCHSSSLLHHPKHIHNIYHLLFKCQETLQWFVYSPHSNTLTNLSPYSVEVQWYASSASPSIQCQTQLVIIDHSVFHFVTCFRSNQIRSDQLLSHARLFETPWVAARQASLSITNPRSSLSLTSIESVMPSTILILSCPLLLLLPIPLSIRVFSYESTLHMRWPK